MILRDMESGVSEREACKRVGISRNTFRSAALKMQASDHYARALEGMAMDQIEKLESVIEEMRDGKLDFQIARIEIDARKWFASKFLPKRFGDKMDVVSGGEKLAPNVVNLNYLTPRENDDNAEANT